MSAVSARLLRGPGITLLVLFLWEMLARFLGTRPSALPAPSRVILEVASAGTKWGSHSLFTFSNIVLGYFLALASALPAAALAERIGFLRRLLSPLFFSPVRLALPVCLPLVFVWMGLGTGAIVAIVFLPCFAAAGAGFLRGFLSIPAELDDLSRSMGMSWARAFLYVKFPAGLSCAFCGMKEAVPLALMGAISAEFAQADRGLGFLMLTAVIRFETTAIFAALAILAIGGSVLYGLVCLVETVALPHLKESPGLPGPCFEESCPRI